MTRGATREGLVARQVRPRRLAACEAATKAFEIAGMVRHAMIRWTSEMRGVREYFDDDRISRLVCGHRDAQSPERATGGHFAVVPLPSLASHGKADGWIRRVAIVGHGIHATEDEELFAELDRDRVIGELRCLDKSQEARALSFFSGPGERWRTVTPIVLMSYTRHGRSRENACSGHWSSRVLQQLTSKALRLIQVRSSQKHWQHENIVCRDISRKPSGSTLRSSSAVRPPSQHS